MSLQNVIQLNNLAVFLLESRRHDSAIEHAVQAMELFRQIVSTHEELALAARTPPSERVGAAFDHFMSLNENSHECDDDVIDDDFYVYEHGVALPPSAATEIRLLAPVLIFNAGLAYQLHASTLEPSDSRRNAQLFKAQRIYQLALSEESVIYSYAFKFAIINNLATICRMIGEDDAARNCEAHLVSLWMCRDCIGGSSMPRHLKGFWKNVLGRGKLAPAA